MADQISIPESFPGPGVVAGKRVVITGASRGLGALLAHAFSTAITGHTAQGRWAAPTDLAGAYRFLASDASAFVTGTVLSVDGGYLLV